MSFSDNSFGILFADLNIDIHDDKYMDFGSSKANKLRSFWKQEPDEVVGPALGALLDHKEAILANVTPSWSDTEQDEQERGKENELMEFCRAVASRLCSGCAHIQPLKDTALEFNYTYLSSQIARLEEAVEKDPGLAIGTSKELIETCCRTILRERGKSIPNSPDLSELTKLTFKELKLTPDDVPDTRKGSKAIRRILSNLAQVGVGVAELRNLYGTGHGKDGNTVGLTRRHARLATGAAATLTTFLFTTHKEQLGG